jgi:E3 ubiquitin-protein ligase DOA10
MLLPVSIVFLILAVVDSFTNRHINREKKIRQFLLALVIYILAVVVLKLVFTFMIVGLSYIIPVNINIFFDNLFEILTLALSGVFAIMWARKDAEKHRI